MDNMDRIDNIIWFHVFNNLSLDCGIWYGQLVGNKIKNATFKSETNIPNSFEQLTVLYQFHEGNPARFYNIYTWLTPTHPSAYGIMQTVASGAPRWATSTRPLATPFTTAFSSLVISLVKVCMHNSNHTQWSTSMRHIYAIPGGNPTGRMRSTIFSSYLAGTPFYTRLMRGYWG